MIAAIGVLGVLFAGSFVSSDSIAGSPAQTALVRMDQHFASPDVQSAQLVFQARRVARSPSRPSPDRCRPPPRRPRRSPA